MSPKNKLGRNPFDKGTARSGGSGAARKTRGAKRPRDRAYRRTKGHGLLHLLSDLTHYWIPRVRACAYLRAVKIVSRFAAD